MVNRHYDQRNQIGRFFIFFGDNFFSWATVVAQLVERDQF